MASKKYTVGKKTAKADVDSNTKTQKQTSVFGEAAAVGLCIAAIFIFISFVTDLTGILGVWIKNICFGLMSYAAFVVPVVLIVMAISIFAHSAPRAAGGKFLFAFGAAASLSALIQVSLGKVDWSHGTKIMGNLYYGGIPDYNGMGARALPSGGLIGGLLGGGLMEVAGALGTALISCFVLIVCFMMLTGLTVMTVARHFKRLGGRIRQTAEDINKNNTRAAEAPSIEFIKSVKTDEKRRNRLTEIDDDDELAPFPIGDEKRNIVQNGGRSGAKNRKIGGEKIPGFDDTERDLDEFYGDNKRLGYVPEDMEDVFVMSGGQNTYEGSGQNIIVPDEMDEADRLRKKRAAAKSYNDIPDENENSDAIDDLQQKWTVKKPDMTQEEDERKRAFEKEGRDVLDDDEDDNLSDEGKKVQKAAAGKKDKPYKAPPISLLVKNTSSMAQDISNEMKINSNKLLQTLDSFGVKAKIINISRGPTVTRYELQPNEGIRINKISALSDDLALHLAAKSIRIEAPIPGKNAIGIEIPNKEVSTVFIRELIDNPAFVRMNSPITAALGLDIAGEKTVIDLSKMPHLLIAGATNSGKSVCVNSIIISLLYKSSPEDLKLLLIDPKMVELSGYNGIPHLIVPVVTDPKKAAGALNWAVSEMTRRYKLFESSSVRNIASYNALAESNPDIDIGGDGDNYGDGENKIKKLPYMVIIVDELADLMLAAKNEIEDYICRLAQMARAAGMHLIIATQRPSVDVVTGLIKANIPSRIAFTVTSQIDSRTILDSAGAEKLLGRGDMLYAPMGAMKPIRLQGCYVTDNEIEDVVNFIKDDRVEYSEEISQEIENAAAKIGVKKSAERNNDDGADEEEDVMYNDAVNVVVDAGMASVTLLQRKLKLGYARASRIMDMLEEKGIVGPYEGAKPRAVLITKTEWLSR